MGETRRAQWSGPSEYRILYSEHYADSYFQPGFTIAASMGLQKCRTPKPDAIPTLFERPFVQLPSLNSAGALILAREVQILSSPANHDAPSQPKKRMGGSERDQE